MTFSMRKPTLLLLPVLFLFTLATQSVASAPALPNPVLYLTGTQPFQQGGKQFIRYQFDVLNKDSYPAEMFAAAPALPPCGANTKSSRTWVDIYDQSGKRLYGFCALAKPSDRQSDKKFSYKLIRFAGCDKDSLPVMEATAPAKATPAATSKRCRSLTLS